MRRLQRQRGRGGARARGGRRAAAALAAAGTALAPCWTAWAGPRHPASNAAGAAAWPRLRPAPGRWVAARRATGAEVEAPEPESSPSPVLLATAVGLLTGSIVVLLNVVVHWGRDSIEALPGLLPLLGPSIGGGLVSLLLAARSSQGGLTGGTDVRSLREAGGRAPKDPTMAPARAAAAAVTLAGGNSLGPEGPSVEIGANVAAAFGETFLSGRDAGSEAVRQRHAELRLQLLAAGCASGIAAGFNAPVAGLFFALESVRPADSGASGPAMQFLAAVLAATVSQLGLGSTPAVDLDKVFWEPRESLWELPLFLLLGTACGVVAAGLRLARQAAGKGFAWLADLGVPSSAFPIVAGLLVAAVSQAGLEEVIYRGFANVNLVLQEVDGAVRPPGAPVSGGGDYLQHLAGLLAAKVLLTAGCQASGQVGGVFAPALFMGSCLGGIFGRALRDYAWPWPLVFGDIHAFSVPATYAIVGMSACLGSICGVPLTAVVLLVELTGGSNYGVVLPTVAAVGMAVYVEDLIMGEGGVGQQLQGAELGGLRALARRLEWIVSAPVRRSLRSLRKTPLLEAPVAEAKTGVTGAVAADAKAPVAKGVLESDTGVGPGAKREVVAAAERQPFAPQLWSAASRTLMAVRPGTPVRQVLLWMQRRRVEVVAVSGKERPLGAVVLEDLLTRLELDSNTAVEEVMRPAVEWEAVGQAGTPLVRLAPGHVLLREAQARLRADGQGARLLVLGQSEPAQQGVGARETAVPRSAVPRPRLLGVANLEDVERALRLAEAMQALGLHRPEPEE